MKSIYFLLMFLFMSLSCFAQLESGKLNNCAGIGFNVTQIQSDFGVGMNIVSPYFFQKKMAVRLRGNFMFNEHIKDSLVEWSSYSNLSFGFIGVGGMIGDRIRCYGEGGMLCLLPSQDFSDEEIVLGGYGLLGFEFFVSKGFGYYIEIGGAGTGATAEKVPGKPIYSNGFLIGTGIRIVFSNRSNNAIGMKYAAQLE